MPSWTERWYACAPLGIQNLAISLYGLGYYHERFGGKFGQFVEEFRERDRWSVEMMRAYLEKKLRQRLLHAFDHTVYHQ